MRAIGHTATYLDYVQPQDQFAGNLKRAGERSYIAAQSGVYLPRRTLIHHSAPGLRERLLPFHAASSTATTIRFPSTSSAA
jgi:hypothetical protein